MLARRFCFTANNTEVDKPRALESVAQFAIWQEETAPTTGTKHLQGYVELKSPQRPSALIKLMQAHYTVCNGTQQQNIAYCTKEPRVSGPYTFGEKKQEHGKRKDLEDAVELAKSGATKRKIITEAPEVFLKYRSGLLDIKQAFAPIRNTTTQGIFVYGKPGSGKTHYFKQLYPNAYWKDNSIWWPDYDNEKVVIWDEFESSKYSIQDLKMLLNHCPLKVQFKGGYANFTSLVIVFLSNNKLEELYPQVEAIHQQALYSRFRQFKMSDRKLKTMPSPEWEKRFGLTHDMTLPSVYFNELADEQSSELMQIPEDLSDSVQASTLSETIPLSPKYSLENMNKTFMSSHPYGLSPNTLFIRANQHYKHIDQRQYIKSESKHIDFVKPTMASLDYKYRREDPKTFRVIGSYYPYAYEDDAPPDDTVPQDSRK